MAFLPSEVTDIRNCHRQKRSPYSVFTSMLYLLYFVPNRTIYPIHCDFTARRRSNDQQHRFLHHE